MRKGRWRGEARASFTAATGVALVLPFAPGEPLPCVALFAALGLVQGASFASIPQLNRESGDQALANGALAQAGNLCGTPLLLALLASNGYGAMLALVVVCYVAAPGAHAWLATRRRIQGDRVTGRPPRSN